MRTPASPVGSRLMTKAAPPSDTGQQSSSLSGIATGFDAITSATVIGSWNCAPGWVQAWARISTANSARSSSRHAVFMHVAGGDEAVIGGNGRPERHLVGGMADLRQRLDRGVAALPGQAVLAGDHEHMLRTTPASTR